MSDTRLAPETRANAVLGLALAEARCDHAKTAETTNVDTSAGFAERRALEDSSEVVRLAAAIAVRVSKAPEDIHALDRCAATDRSASVARRCRTFIRPNESAHAVVVYVAGEGHTSPAPGASYLLAFADGALRAGTTDRRGAVFEPHAPAGDVTLRRRGDSH